MLKTNDTNISQKLKKGNLEERTKQSKTQNRKRTKSHRVGSLKGSIKSRVLSGVFMIKREEARIRSGEKGGQSPVLQGF